MISGEQIQQAVERLVAAANPSKAILFGSYARGNATEDSDLDLMVIEPQLEQIWRDGAFAPGITAIAYPS